MSRLHPEFLPTFGVLLTAAWVVGALVTPPDPFTQLLSLAPSPVAAGLLAALLTYGRGFAALGWSPSGVGDHGWTLLVFFAVTVLVGVVTPDTTSLVVTAVGPAVGLSLGAWLGWGDGRSRLSRTESPA